jgi:hypothetical protein
MVCAFRTPHAWVQVVYDVPTEAVIQFSITVTDPKPPLR